MTVRQDPAHMVLAKQRRHRIKMNTGLAGVRDDSRRLPWSHDRRQKGVRKRGLWGEIASITNGFLKG